MTSVPKDVVAKRRCDLLVRNGFVITVDGQRQIFFPGAVAISGNRILWVGPDAEASGFDPTTTIDAKGAPVHPGLIEPHAHASLHSTRGAISDAPDAKGPSPFRLWYNAVDDEDEYASGLHCAVELLRNGFTSFMDPGSVFEPDAVARAATEVGVRSSLADPFLWDIDGGQLPLDRAPVGRERSLRLLGTQLKRNNQKDTLSRGHVALYGMATASEELMLQADAVARKASTTLTLHQSFTAVDTARDDARFNGHPLVHYARIGALGTHSSFAHMNILRDDEIATVVETGMSVLWQPGNYQYYTVSAHAPSPMMELAGRGASLALCADVPKMWTFGDMGLVAYLSVRDKGGYLPAERLMEMQTIAAARAIGRDSDLGSLEPGKLADIVVRDPDCGEAQPALDPVRDIVLTARSKSVRTVIVDGRVVLRDRQTQLVDQERAWQLSRNSARAIVQRLGFSPGSRWPAR